MWFLATSLQSWSSLPRHELTEFLANRKVKCEMLEDGTKCKQCADHGVECKSRTRKRKAHSLDESQREYDDSVPSLPSPSASRNRQDASDASSVVSKKPVHRSSSVSVPELFVNRDSGTGVSPESSEHVDAPAQDRFRNASFISRSAILGNDFQNIDHIHTEVVGEEKLSSIDLKVLKLHGAFELPDPPLRESLIEAYTERCYTWMPVVDLQTFVGASQTGEGSMLLLQAVMLVGSLMRPDVCSKSYCDRQYMRVKALVQSGYERNPLNVLAALCLIQWYTPTAPKDISMDVPRFWNTVALGLAQQMGLHRASTKQVLDSGLRNRIWWTIVVRDNLTASAHGRPRVIQSEDCTVQFPTTSDFSSQQDIRAEIFIYYIAILRILGDLCQLITRSGEASFEDKQGIAVRLDAYLEALPEHLKLYSPRGLAQQYNLELAQLHVPILIAITILFRPETVYQLTAANAASITAAFLSFRVFQAIQLREQTRFLGSPFAWHLLVTAIPLLSCTKVSALRDEANEALDAVENVLETLGRVRPAAVNNLHSVRAIRKAITSRPHGAAGSNAVSDTREIQASGSKPFGRQLLQAYGQEAVSQYEQIADVLRTHSNDRHAQAAAHTLSCLSRPDTAGMNTGHLTPEPEIYLPSTMAHEDMQNAFTAVFEDDTLSSSWMMRDWFDLDVFPEIA